MDFFLGVMVGGSLVGSLAAILIIWASHPVEDVLLGDGLDYGYDPRTSGENSQ